MVQLYGQGGFPGPGPNEYWKLDSGTTLTTRSLREYLSNRDVTTLKQTTKPRLSELYIRCQCGLLSYEGRSLRELREFTVQRAVPVDSKATLNSIKALKELLETADDIITFDRFSDLPPELRQIVFLHYFDSLVVREAWYKHQPPITLVSRNIRKESQPLFYECCNFRIGAFGDFSTIPCKLVPDAEAAPLMRSIATENFARIKSLKLEFHNPPGAHIQLDLRDKNNPVVFAKVFAYSWVVPRNPREAGHQWFLSELSTLARGIVSREGPLKVRVSDIEEMCELARQSRRILDSTVS